MSVFDPKQFLGELGFSGQELDDVAAKFTGDRATGLEKSVKRQSDYSRSMDQGRAELEAQRAALEAKEAQLTAEATEWANLTAAEKRHAGELQARLEQTEAEALRHRQTLERMAREAGVDPQTLLGSSAAATTTAPPAAPAAPAVDTSKFADRDHVRQLAQMSLHLPAQIADLKDEHFALTGQRLNSAALVAELERRATTKGNTKSTDLRAIWEETHNIGQIRADAEAARIKSIEDAAYTRGREAALTETSLPPGAEPTGRHAVIFNPDRKSALQRPQPAQGLQGAINAFRTGKYRQSS